MLAEQTERMAAVLRENNLPVEVYTFAEEGHVFRNSQVKIKVLEENAYESTVSPSVSKMLTPTNDQGESNES